MQRLAARPGQRSRAAQAVYRRRTTGLVRIAFLYILLLAMYIFSGASSTQAGENTAKNQPEIQFKDVETHWARKSILGAVSLGLVKGFPDSTFRPENTVTRAEFVTMLVRAEDAEVYKDLPASFQDTLEHWVHSGGFLETAVKWGFVKPEDYGDRRFEPDKPITREEIAVLLVRALDKEQDALNYSSAPLQFRDAAEISRAARGHIFVAASKGLITGYEDQTFRPKNTATRAEAVTMLLRRLDAGPTVGCLQHH